MSEFVRDDGLREISRPSYISFDELSEFNEIEFTELNDALNNFKRATSLFDNVQKHLTTIDIAAYAGYGLDEIASAIDTQIEQIKYEAASIAADYGYVDESVFDSLIDDLKQNPDYYADASCSVKTSAFDYLTKCVERNSDAAVRFSQLVGADKNELYGISEDMNSLFEAVSNTLRLEHEDDALRMWENDFGEEQAPSVVDTEVEAIDDSDVMPDNIDEIVSHYDGYDDYVEVNAHRFDFDIVRAEQHAAETADQQVAGICMTSDDGEAYVRDKLSEIGVMRGQAALALTQGYLAALYGIAHSSGPVMLNISMPGVEVNYMPDNDVVMRVTQDMLGEVMAPTDDIGANAEYDEYVSDDDDYEYW